MAWAGQINGRRRSGIWKETFAFTLLERLSLLHSPRKLLPSFVRLSPNSYPTSIPLSPPPVPPPLPCINCDPLILLFSSSSCVTCERACSSNGCRSLNPFYSFGRCRKGLTGIAFPFTWHTSVWTNEGSPCSKCTDVRRWMLRHASCLLPFPLTSLRVRFKYWRSTIRAVVGSHCLHKPNNLW